MIKVTLKCLLAFALCFWLFKNGKLDFSLIIKSVQLGNMWIWALLFLLSRLFISSVRFQLLINTKAKNKITFYKVLVFDAIGNFFSIILPGASGGDLVKFFYIKKSTEGVSNTTLVSLLVLDRLIGLLGLVGLGTLVCFIQWDSLYALNPGLIPFIYINAVIFFILGLFLILFFTPILSHQKILDLINRFTSNWPKIKSSFIDLLSIRLSYDIFIKCFVLSLFNQIMIFAGFWMMASPFLPEGLSFLNLFAIIPIGMIGSSVPITPSGLGVGHVLFDNLFKLLGVVNGASLFNLFFVAYTLINLLGVIPYVLYKNELKPHTGNKL